MFEYKLKPKEGYHIASMVIEGANIDNSVIAVVDSRTGIEVAEIPVTETTLNLLNPELPNVKFELLHSDGVIREMPISWKEDVLYGGSNPFDQIIVKIVKESGKITEDEVITKIIKDYALCEDTKENREKLRERIKWLRDNGYLNLKFGYLELGVAKLPRNEIRIPLEVGYNPIIKRMFEIVEAYGSVEIRKLELYMVYELKWCTSDEFKQYLDLMLRKGWLRKVNDFEVTTDKPIEPYR